MVKSIILRLLDENSTLQRQEELLEALIEVMLESQILREAGVDHSDKYEHAQHQSSLITTLVNDLRDNSYLWNRFAFNAMI